MRNPLRTWHSWVGLNCAPCGAVMTRSALFSWSALPCLDPPSSEHSGQVLQRKQNQPLFLGSSFNLPRKGLVDTGAGTWQEATWKPQQLKVLVEALGSGFTNASCTTLLLRHSWEEMMGAGLLCQGSVTNPKAIQYETSNRMWICSLCNNVTKILIKLTI